LTISLHPKHHIKDSYLDFKEGFALGNEKKRKNFSIEIKVGKRKSSPKLFYLAFNLKEDCI